MIRTLIHYSIFLGLLICLLLMLLGYVSRHQTPIGLIEGQLMNCPERPVCVSSQQEKKHPSRIKALTYDFPAEQALDQARDCVQQIGGTVHKVENGYLWATFDSAVFGFVDDLELYLEPERNRIQVRSASRIGYYDFGKNRKRVDKLKACFQGSQHLEND